MQSPYFESNCRLSTEEYHQGIAYVAKLEQWASAIRLQRNIGEKRELEQVLRSLQQHLQKVITNLSQLSPCVFRIMLTGLTAHSTHYCTNVLC